MDRTTNIFDKIGTLIPGYRGYNTRECRRNSDKILREKISGKLTEVENELNTKIKKFIEDREIRIVRKTEENRKEINTIGSRIKFASYGTSSFFSDSQITEKELDKIYHFDLELEEISTELLNYITNNHSMTEVTNFISQLKNILDKRNNFINDFK
jgi:hypothetical protein